MRLSVRSLAPSGRTTSYGVRVAASVRQGSGAGIRIISKNLSAALFGQEANNLDVDGRDMRGPTNAPKHRHLLLYECERRIAPAGLLT